MIEKKLVDFRIKRLEVNFAIVRKYTVKTTLNVNFFIPKPLLPQGNQN